MAHVYPLHKLPRFLISSYSYKQKNNTIQTTKFQSGRTRSRLLSVVAPESYSLTTVMTSDQLAIFEAWLMHTVKYIEPMLMPIATASACDDKEVKLIDNSFAKNAEGGSKWRITISVEAEKQSVMSEAELAAALL